MRVYFIRACNIISKCFVMDNDLRREIIAKSPITYKWAQKTQYRRRNPASDPRSSNVKPRVTITWNREIYTFYLKFKIITLIPFKFQVLPDPQVAFKLNYLGVILASFLLISAAAHFIIAFLKTKQYEENLKKGMNPYRWYEYALSSSIMLTFLSTFVGVWDLWSLVMIFVLNATMIMFGYLMEKINQYTKKTDWSAYLLGCISGFTPWVVTAAYFIAALGSGETKPPTSST